MSNIGEQAALLALMFRHACEYTKLYVYGVRHSNAVYDSLDSLLVRDGVDDSILGNVQALMEFSALPSRSTEMQPAHASWRHALRTLCADRGQHRELTFDNIVLLSTNELIGSGRGEAASDEAIFMRSFLRQYRAERNARLLFVNVSLSAATSACQLANNTSEYFTHPDDVQITGFSDSILRFVAERATAHAQLVHIDHIHKAYNLPLPSSKRQMEMEVDQTCTTQLPLVRNPKWRSVKVFISSTFADMHGERDILGRVCFTFALIIVIAKLNFYKSPQK